MTELGLGGRGGGVAKLWREVGGGRRAASERLKEGEKQ